LRDKCKLVGIQHNKLSCHCDLSGGVGNRPALQIKMHRHGIEQFVEK